MLAAIDATRQAAFRTLLTRLAEMPDRTLVLGVPATARWIQGLVDAAHLAADETPVAETAEQLRRIVGWLLGR